MLGQSLDNDILLRAKQKIREVAGIVDGPEGSEWLVRPQAIDWSLTPMRRAHKARQQAKDEQLANDWLWGKKGSCLSKPYTEEWYALAPLAYVKGWFNA